MKVSLLEEIPGWFRDKGPDDDVIISSKIRLSRNLTGFLFPNKISAEDELRVKEILMEAFSGFETEFNIFYKDNIDSSERRLLAERNLITQEFALNKHKSFFISEDQKTVGLINSHDHLRLIRYESGFALDDAYKQIDKIESLLEKKLDFSVSLEFGYMNENVRNSGTGLKASLMFYLPALVHLSLFDRAIKSSLHKNLIVKGYSGDSTDSLGDLYQISNGISIGMDEKEFLDILRDTGQKLLRYERQAREELLIKRKIELEDRYYRAVGLLTYCRKIGSSEALRLLSDLRLGIVFGWSEFKLETINSLIFFTQTAHIQTINDGTMKEGILIDTVRADLIRDILELKE